MEFYDLDEFAEVTQADNFNEWHKAQTEKDTKRIHLDTSTREGLIAHIIDLFDQLGYCTYINVQRDENGSIMYDENGEMMLLEGETEPKFLDRANVCEKFSSFHK